jgi:hypothetical protein
MGDCERANVHHSCSVALLAASVDNTGLLSRRDSNHASVASQVVQTSKLGPAAR